MRNHPFFSGISWQVLNVNGYSGPMPKSKSVDPSNGSEYASKMSDNKAKWPEKVGTIKGNEPHLKGFYFMSPSLKT